MSRPKRTHILQNNDWGPVWFWYHLRKGTVFQFQRAFFCTLPKFNTRKWLKKCLIFWTNEKNKITDFTKKLAEPSKIDFITNCSFAKCVITNYSFAKSLITNTHLHNASSHISMWAELSLSPAGRPANPRLDGGVHLGFAALGSSPMCPPPLSWRTPTWVRRLGFGPHGPANPDCGGGARLVFAALGSSPICQPPQCRRSPARVCRLGFESHAPANPQCAGRVQLGCAVLGLSPMCQPPLRWRRPMCPPHPPECSWSPARVCRLGCQPRVPTPAALVESCLGGPPAWGLRLKAEGSDGNLEAQIEYLSCESLARIVRLSLCICAVGPPGACAPCRPWPRQSPAVDGLSQHRRQCCSSQA